MTPSSTTGAFILDLGPAFSLASCAVFDAVLSLGCRFLKFLPSVLLELSLCGGYKRMNA